MKLYRFSPIENKDELLEAIKYTHLKCFELCKKVFGKYLTVAGNIGIFCHYDTEKSDNWNQKYYRLHEPIRIPAQGKQPSLVD